MATMGRNNWLLLDEDGSVPGSAIAFRWGDVRNHSYRLGETVDWRNGERPPTAAGEHFVPGLAFGASVGRRVTPLYYLIRIIDDLIVSVDLADEAGFAGAEAALVARGIRQ